MPTRCLCCLICLILTGSFGYATGCYAAASPEIWFGPPDNVAQPKNKDFRDFFVNPDSWKHAAGHIKVFSVTASYLLRAPASDASRLLSQLAMFGLRLDVSVSALPTDKTICGDGIEGMVWAREPIETAMRLKALGADVYSFSLDLPLVAGVVSRAPGACRLTIEETATRLSRSVKDLLTIYPTARIIDGEVPTGLPVNTWSTLLTSWLAAFQRASGRQFDGFGMDIWYEGEWRPALLITSRILSEFGVQAGVVVDASEGSRLTPTEWIAKTKKLVCAVERLHTSISFLAVANWVNLDVPNLPETDSDSLTALVNWVSTHRDCVY